MNFTRELLLIWSFTLMFVIPNIKCQENNYTAILERKNELPKDVVNVISHCYLESQSIVLAGNWGDDNIRIINKIFNSVILFYTIGLKENRHFQIHKRLKNVYKMTATVIRKLKYPGNRFILMIYDMTDLSKSMALLKKSMLWNHQGTFLIVCKDTQAGCQNARSFLELMWSYRILSAALLCYGKHDTATIFTFNPYTDLAPNFWSPCPNKQNKKSNWTLYQRSLGPALESFYDILCENLFFDKTNNLGGYNINAGVYINDLYLPYKPTESSLKRYGGFSGQISSMIWNHVNATVHVTNYTKSKLIDDNTLPKSLLRDVLKGKIEITLNVNLLRDFWKLQTYPLATTGLCIISRRRTSDIKWEEILFLQPYWSIASGVIYCCLLASLKYMTRRSCSFAFLESIRAMVSSQICFQPMSTGGRHLLINFVFITMLLRIYFQSYLTSVDVVPSHNTVIDTADKIVQSNRTVYGSLDYKENLRDLDIENRYRFGVYKDCRDRLLNGQELVCLASCHEARRESYDAEALHITEAVKNHYLSFTTVEDWPLVSKFNQVMMSLSERGFIDFILRQESYNYTKHECQSESYPKLSWENVKIIWYLWLAGLTLATVVLFIELYVEKIKNVQIHLFEKRK